MGSCTCSGILYLLSKEGHGWWCGLEVDDRKGHVIRLNQPKNEAFMNSLLTSMKDAFTDKFTTWDNMNKLLSVLSFIDSGNSENADLWGEYLGKWIDYDKRNINNMNKALARINTQMTVSMKIVAENTLKSMLQDPRLDHSEALKDYYICIHIPEGKNPYENEGPRSSAPKSLFSPKTKTIETDVESDRTNEVKLEKKRQKDDTCE